MYHDVGTSMWRGVAMRSLRIMRSYATSALRARRTHEGVHDDDGVMLRSTMIQVMLHATSE